jgi:hypothetical protein
MRDTMSASAAAWGGRLPNSFALLARLARWRGGRVSAAGHRRHPRSRLSSARNASVNGRSSQARWSASP